VIQKEILSKIKKNVLDFMEHNEYLVGRCEIHMNFTKKRMVFEFYNEVRKSSNEIIITKIIHEI